jgi:hypothetical protein
MTKQKYLITTMMYKITEENRWKQTSIFQNKKEFWMFEQDYYYPGL